MCVCFHLFERGDHSGLGIDMCFVSKSVACGISAYVSHSISAYVSHSISAYVSYSKSAYVSHSISAYVSHKSYASLNFVCDSHILISLCAFSFT
jgi:hypothetical protein